MQGQQDCFSGLCQWHVGLCMLPQPSARFSKGLSSKASSAQPSWQQEREKTQLELL